MSINLDYPSYDTPTLNSNEGDDIELDNDDVDSLDGEYCSHVLPECQESKLDPQTNSQLEKENIHTLRYVPPEATSIPLHTEDDPLCPRIVASLMSSYEGLHYVRQTLMSLHNQEFDCIYLNVPGHRPDLIPDWIKVCCEVTYSGDSEMQHLIHVLERERHPDTIIITVENGMIYPPQMVKQAKAALARCNRSAYACEVYKFKSINYFQRVTVNHNIGDSFEGERGVVYLRNFFRNDFSSYLTLAHISNACRHCPYLLIMNYLQLYKINIRCLARKFYSAALVYPVVNKERLYTNSGLNYKIVSKYAQAIQHLHTKRILYLRNPNAVIECVRHLAMNPYGGSFRT